MRFSHIRLQDYRNLEFSSLELSGNRHFFIGTNGQGKTNLLEAFSLVTALRSFRTQENRALINHKKQKTSVEYQIEHEVEGEVGFSLSIEGKKKQVQVDGEAVRRLADLMGRFPTVVLCSEDINMLRGAPSTRRRFLDLTLAGMDPQYFNSLRRYYKVLQERNTLLRQGLHRMELLDTYDPILAKDGWILYQKRIEGSLKLGEYLKNIYHKLSPEDEDPEFIYKSDIPLEGPDTLLKILQQSRQRDLLMKSTQRGLHRDDILLKIKSKSAKEYGSEGQQRGLVIALRLAQINYIKERLNILPVVLIDDVLGQLDPIRSKRFWSIVDPRLQIIATGTQMPQESHPWQIFQVKEGSFIGAEKPVEPLAI